MGKADGLGVLAFYQLIQHFSLATRQACKQPFNLISFILMQMYFASRSLKHWKETLNGVCIKMNEMRLNGCLQA